MWSVCCPSAQPWLQGNPSLALADCRCPCKFLGVKGVSDYFISDEGRGKKYLAQQTILKMLISNPGWKKKSWSVNGSLLITYKAVFVSLQSKGPANFIGGVAFLGFVFLADLLFWWFVFEGKILFPDSDGEIPGVMCLPVPLKMKPALWSSVGQVPCWLSHRLRSQLWDPVAAPRGSCWRNLSHQHTRPAGIPGLLGWFSKAQGLEYRWRCWQCAWDDVTTAGRNGIH